MRFGETASYQASMQANAFKVIYLVAINVATAGWLWLIFKERLVSTGWKAAVQNQDPIVPPCRDLIRSAAATGLEALFDQAPSNLALNFGLSFQASAIICRAA